MNFLASADFPFQLALSPAAAGLHFDGKPIARVQARYFLARFLSRRLPQQFDDGVADLQPSALGLAVRSHRNDRHGAVKITGRYEAGVGNGDRCGLDMQPDGAQKIVPGNLLSSTDVAGEKRSEIGMADRLRGLANADGIIEE